MKRDDASSPQLLPPREQVEQALSGIERSAAFRGSPRHRSLLRHLVMGLLDDSAAALKETVIAVEVFGRPAASFDPKQDSIVRVEARRLRARLATYYRSEGGDAPIRIELPVGSYLPAFVADDTVAPVPGLTRHARDLVERGEHFLRQALSKQTLEQARERFEQAIDESPGHAPAWVGLGRAWLNLATGWYADPAAASGKAGLALRRALELDPTNAIAHALLGAIQHQFEHDWAEARRSFRRALALAPGLAFVHSAYGCHLVIHGAFDDAERELKRARQIDPHYLNTRQHMINLRIAQGRWADAQAEAEALADIAPTTMAIAGIRGMIAMCRGDAAEAIRHYAQACEAMPEYAGCHVALAGALALAGAVDDADALMAQTHQRFAGQLQSPYVLAIYATRRGRHDEAFALLARAIEQRDPQAMQIPTDPSFAALHGDPRWAVPRPVEGRAVPGVTA